MEPRLAALKLFLDQLGVPMDISTVQARKTLQKAVYLGQLSGVDLGYRFSWYLMGPYSPKLTRAYYDLEEALADEAAPDAALATAARERLTRVRGLIEAAHETHLSRSQWLELVASYHFLRKVSMLDHAAARQRLHEQKPQLADHVDRARAALEGAGLL